MKPTMFKNQEELMNFLQRLPAPHGEAKVREAQMDASAIIDRCIALVPQIFEYKSVLVKNGGFGSNKAVFRYADVASDSVSQEKIAAYGEALAAINRECEILIEQGGGEELAETLRSARTQVAAFTKVRETIEGFRDKLNKYMERVEDKYSDLSNQLTKKKRELAGVLESDQLNLLVNEIKEKHTTVSGLIDAMDEYCALQVAYNGIMIGASKGR